MTLSSGFLPWSRHRVRPWHAAVVSSSHSLGRGAIGLSSGSFVAWRGALEMRQEAVSVVHMGKVSSRSVMGAAVWAPPKVHFNRRTHVRDF